LKHQFASARIRTYSEQRGLASCLGAALAAFRLRMPDTRRDSFADDVRRIETSDRQNREGQQPLSAGPRAGYRRDWLVVWRLESARAHDRTRQRRSHRHADTRHPTAEWLARQITEAFLCVPKTLSALISRRNHLTSVDHVRTVFCRKTQ
jgi:hypothetical protein